MSVLPENLQKVIFLHRSRSWRWILTKLKKVLLELPGIGDYSADIINPHGGFPIDVWSAEVFAKLFFDKKPDNNREAVDKVKNEGLKRWGGVVMDGILLHCAGSTQSI